MHKLQELFHELANKINTMNNTVAMTALMHLNKDLYKLTEEEKNSLLDKLKDTFTKTSNNYQEVVDAENEIISQISFYNKSFDVLECFDKIMHIIHDAAHKYRELLLKINGYKPDSDFEGYIKPILNEALEFDKSMAHIAELLEKAKEPLRKQGLYPKKGEE